MDEKNLKHGVNLIDTAEQYPIPSDPLRFPEGTAETVMEEHPLVPSKAISLSLIGRSNQT